MRSLIFSMVRNLAQDVEMKPHLYIVIPAMDELEFLPKTLQAIHSQKTDYPYSVFVCVNQPDDWWDKEDKREVCLQNRKLLLFLASESPVPVNVIDCSSPGKGWKGKKYGVGWARKVLFDTIFSVANADDILICLDADTLFEESYFQSIGDNLSLQGSLPVVTVPYYHKLTQTEEADKAILRYEIYLRNWLLNMIRIRSFYAFTAIGSAIALKVWALKKIGGITPMKSGEDFYLIQKLRKMVSVNLWNKETVYPAARFSDRVCFGTGPAMIKGAQGDWKSYPVYHNSLFDDIEKTYSLIEKLYKEDQETAFLSFLQEQFKEKNLWEPLRKNCKTLSLFTHAFHEKADGLRIIQFIKKEHEKNSYSDEKGLYDNLKLFTEDELPPFIKEGFSFELLSVDELSEIRDLLFRLEMNQRLLFANGF